MRADKRELLEFARADLAHFKAPHSVTFVNELPKNNDRQNSEYMLERNACDLSAVAQFVFPACFQLSTFLVTGRSSLITPKHFPGVHGFLRDEVS
jgi:hypothetical protein